MDEPRIVEDGEAGRREAVARLAAGGAIALATETFYGLCADPRSAVAVRRVLELKGERGSKPLPLLAASARQVEAVAPGWRSSPLAEALAAAFWPGPLTLVLDGGKALSVEVRGEDGSVGVRWGGASPAAQLGLRFGSALVATSANPSGCPPPRTAGEAAAGFRGRALLILDSGPAPGRAPSSVVDPRGSEPLILREGAIGAAEIHLACPGRRR